MASQVFGHDRVREQLEVDLPDVTLLLGPASVGKRALAQHLLDHRGVHVVDRWSCDQLTAEAARDLHRFAATGPVGRAGKAAVVRLDGATETALNALLKLLEEPPPRFKVVLTTTRPTLPTVTSRAIVCRVGLLTEDELRQVLVVRLGMTQQAATTAARHGVGQVSKALEVGDVDGPRTAVLSALKAVADRDMALLDRALSRWDDASHSLLVQWAYEARTGRWRLFDPTESFGLAREPTTPDLVLSGLRSGARPRLAAFLALEPLCRRERP